MSQFRVVVERQQPDGEWERRVLQPGSWILIERDELGWTDEQFDGLADLVDDLISVVEPEIVSLPEGE